MANTGPARSEFVVVASVLLCVWGCSHREIGSHVEIAGEPNLRVEATELDRTVVTPCFGTEIPEGKNVLWCNTFQLAWNELCDLLGEEALAQFDSPTIAALNKGPATKDELDDPSYVAIAGQGPGVLAEIRRELRRKFYGAALPELLSEPGLGDMEWIAYAYLFKHLPFEWAFTRFEYPMNFDDTEVAAFGIDQYLKDQDDEVKMAGQVVVHDYQAPDDFIIELKTRSEGDRLVLARVPPAETLAETVAGVRRRVSQGQPTGMREAEDLAVPVFDFDILRRYPEVCPPCQIAAQSIRFRLDETGAVLKSEAVAAGGEARSFRFDGPFLILLERKDAKNPYFALWVANAELMVGFQRAADG